MGLDATIEFELLAKFVLNLRGSVLRNDGKFALGIKACMPQSVTNELSFIKVFKTS